MKKSWHWVLVLVVCGGIGAAAKGYSAKPVTDSAPSAAQDVAFLDRRINQLEQRFYSMESRMSRLEQQISMAQRAVPAPAPAPSPGLSIRDNEIDLLRNQAELFKVRVGELECAILRLDERTLSQAAKEARRRAGIQSQDPCRANPDVSVKLSARP